MANNLEMHIEGEEDMLVTVMGVHWSLAETPGVPLDARLLLRLLTAQQDQQWERVCTLPTKSQILSHLTSEIRYGSLHSCSSTEPPGKSRDLRDISHRPGFALVDRYWPKR